MNIVAVAVAQLTESLARLMLSAAKLDAEGVERLTLAVDRLIYDAEHALIERH